MNCGTDTNSSTNVQEGAATTTGEAVTGYPSSAMVVNFAGYIVVLPKPGKEVSDERSGRCFCKW
jgi:hypothetical protein